jgi:CRISPR-associated protein Cmr4
MYTAQQALFFYAISPVHMGAGTALGLIDNPIQREKHTDHPVMAGSGVKGAIRHHFYAQLKGTTEETTLARYFGPDTNASDYAGAVSFSDAQLVAFPVRSSKAGFVYATSPLALARAQRLLMAANISVNWKINSLKTGECEYINAELLSSGKVQVDAFELTAKPSESLKAIAEDLAEKIFPANVAYDFFKNKFKADLVLMSDDDFGYFVKNATLVEPHVKINNETGTAQDGGLFYTENLPPESILMGVLMASDERSKGDNKTSAIDIVKFVADGLSGKLLQIGGDATTGRGQVIVNAVGE